MKVSTIIAFVFTVILTSCNSTGKNENTTPESSEIETSSDSVSNEVDQQPSGSEKLLPIMYQLLADMNRVNEGIIMENYPMIDSSAYRIAHHPKIDPDQMRIIKKNLGKDIQEFVRIDSAVHSQAVSISKAAKQKNMEKILNQYHSLQNSCVNCHNQFRDRIKSNFQ